MSADTSRIRVKAMPIALHPDGTRHLVSRNDPTAENPRGLHRLIGDSVELGETHRDAIVRGVQEELGAGIDGPRFLGVVENIFRFDGELGHELVAVYTGRLDSAPSDDGGTLTESDGTVVPVEWRPLDDADAVLPLYPWAVVDWVRAAAEST